MRGEEQVKVVSSVSKAVLTVFFLHVVEGPIFGRVYGFLVRVGAMCTGEGQESGDGHHVHPHGGADTECEVCVQQ